MPSLIGFEKKEKGWAPFSYNMRFQAPLCWNRREGGGENVQDVCVSKGVKGMLLLLSSTSISAGRDICGCRGGDYRCLFIILFYSYTHPPFIWRGWWRRWVVWKLLIFPPAFSFFSFLLFYRLSSPPPLFSLPRRDVMEEEEDDIVVVFVDLLPLPPFYWSFIHTAVYIYIYTASCKERKEKSCSLTTPGDSQGKKKMMKKETERFFICLF